MADVRETIAAVWKRESATVVAVAMRIVRDLGQAEELAQDALVAALVEWPRSGLPDRPGAWLVTTARNKALNVVKRRGIADRTAEQLRHVEPAPEDVEARLDDDLGDEVLRLVFTACHPVLPQEGRVALTLRLLGGLTTEEIARAFLVAEPTVAQRIVRAKRTLADAGVPFEVPRGEALAPRLASVLEVVYLVFNEGYSATAGDDLMRPALADEAIRLARLLAGLAPAEPEVHGLLALLVLQHSRAAARTDARGDPILLASQDRTQWDRALIAEGLAALDRAEGLPPGPFQLQAAIAACHARAATVEDTDWRRIADLYAELADRWPSPVVELNRALAVSRAEGPAAGLARLDALVGVAAFARYPLLPSARANLLVQLGRGEEAAAEFERAAELTLNARQKERLLEPGRCLPWAIARAMYVPAYASMDPEHLADLVRTWPFATVTTCGPLGLYATHVPLVQTAPDRLIGHVARANPHRADLDGPVLAVFHGPHALVDPRWYRDPSRQVPTWNYLAIHATGSARLLPDPREAVNRLLAATGLAEVRDDERERFVAGLERGIVGFEIAVDRWEAKAKLSQNRDPEDHDRVRDALIARGEGQDLEVAAFMDRTRKSRGFSQGG